MACLTIQPSRAQPEKHLRWSSRYLDEPVRPASRWSSRRRLSTAGYSPACTEGSPDRLRHARSHVSLHGGISIPVPQRRASRGSIYSLVDCLKARQAEAEHQFIMIDSEVQETALDSPPKRFVPLQRKGSSHVTPAEMRRKTFLRKISLQETHVNYNQDYWLEYEKNTRFHASLDFGKYTPEPEPNPMGPKPAEADNSIKSATTKRQSEMPSKCSPKSFTRGESEPYPLVKKCSCNECGPEAKRRLGRAATTDAAPSVHRAPPRTLDVSSTNSSRLLLGNSIRTPSTENLPFLERVGHIETDFPSGSQGSSFSDVSLDCHDIVVTPADDPATSWDALPSRPIHFDFAGGSAFFGEKPLAASTTSLPDNLSTERTSFCIPEVSVSRPSNSPSPLGM